MKYILFILLFLLLSCGEETKKKENTKPVKTAPEVEQETEPEKFREIYDNIEFEKELFIGKVYEGDVIRFKLSGVREFNKFQPTYTRVVDSTWSDRVCIPLPLKRSRHCFDVPKKGKCNLLMRKSLKRDQVALGFSNNLESLRVRIRIGTEYFQFTEITENKESYLILNLKVTRQMLEESQNAYIVVKTPQVVNRIRVGFLRYERCAGLSKKHFKVHGDTSYSIEESVIKEKYLTTVWVKYGKK